MDREEAGAGEGANAPDNKKKKTYASSSAGSARVAVEEALLLAQSRAREAEDVLCRYDVKMEEVVLRALKKLDRSRAEQAISSKRVKELEAAILEQERLCGTGIRREGEEREGEEREGEMPCAGSTSERRGRKRWSPLD
mmetsp:Transcript_59874/g.122872  ORF Transcript_59874/g.122872 Transcript_59874/m.122872 type:complete len:139 (-) Transcript_59874:791-1207(-)